jgi:hypothetical protein
MLHWAPIVLGLHPRHVREHVRRATIGRANQTTRERKDGSPSMFFPAKLRLTHRVASRERDASQAIPGEPGLRDYYCELPVRRASRRSVRPVRRSSRRSWRPVRRSCRRVIPTVCASASDPVSAKVGTARPNAPASTENTFRRDSISDVIFSFMSYLTKSFSQHLTPTHDAARATCEQTNEGSMDVCIGIV